MLRAHDCGWVEDVLQFLARQAVNLRNVRIKLGADLQALFRLLEGISRIVGEPDGVDVIGRARQLRHPRRNKRHILRCKRFWRQNRQLLEVEQAGMHPCLLDALDVVHH